MNNKKQSFRESKTQIILSRSRSVAGELFDNFLHPWEAIPYLRTFICKCGENLPYDQYDEISENIWVHISAYLSPTAKIIAPAIICGGARLCNFTSVEGSIVGSFAKIGEHSSVNSSIIFDKATLCGNNNVNYSILGYHSRIGAGVRFPECRLDGENVFFSLPEGIYMTKSARLGAIVCDEASIGENSVINSGSIINEGTVIQPLSLISGYVEHGCNR